MYWYPVGVCQLAEINSHVKRKSGSVPKLTHAHAYPIPLPGMCRGPTHYPYPVPYPVPLCAHICTRTHTHLYRHSAGHIRAYLRILTHCGGRVLHMLGYYNAL